MTPKQEKKVKEVLNASMVPLSDKNFVLKALKDMKTIDEPPEEYKDRMFKIYEKHPGLSLVLKNIFPQPK
jgi:hypothetical protein